MTVMDALDLSGRHALVTGASSGIGHAIAIALAQSGAQVTLHGKTMANAQVGIIPCGQHIFEQARHSKLEIYLEDLIF